MELQNPAVIGFGISNHATFSKACEYATGAIVGSAFVKFQDTEGYIENIPDFINSIKY
jgi:tryptophan synthase alpha chain